MNHYITAIKFKMLPPDTSQVLLPVKYDFSILFLKQFFFFIISIHKAAGVMERSVVCLSGESKKSANR